MTDDLVQRLRAAIEAKAVNARLALPGTWSVRDDIEIVTSAQVPDKLVVAIGDSGGGVYDVRTAEHIADNDPGATLAMCSAHRQIVDLFALTVRIQDEAAAQIRAARFDAPSAMVYKRWSRASTEVGIMRPLVEALAKGYVLPPEQAT